MRILFITAHKYLPQMRGGLQSSTHELCHALLRNGHSVAVLAGLMPGGVFGLTSRIKMQINDKIGRHKISRHTGLGYPVWFTWFPWDLVECVTRKEQPDLIVVLTYQGVRMALAAQRTGRPILMQLQDVEFHQHGGRFEELRSDITYVANSCFTAGKYRDAFGVNPLVILPFVTPEKYRTVTTGENVTLINPHPKKGGDIALGIARLCPEIPFVFVESWPLSPEDRQDLMQKLTASPNVTFLPPRDEMRGVYGKCRILLAPSVWDEAYGRVATEAHISGIPVVASTRGGLPEAVGPGGILIDPDRPIADWAAAVRKLWQDRRHHAELSAAALAHAQRREITFAYQIGAWERALAEAATRLPPATRNRQ